MINENGVTKLIRGLGGLPLIILLILFLFPCAVTSFLIWRIDERLADLAEAQRSSAEAQRDNVNILKEILIVQRKGFAEREGY